MSSYEWPLSVCLSEVRFWCKAAVVGEPQRSHWKVNQLYTKYTIISSSSVGQWEQAPSVPSTGNRWKRMNSPWKTTSLCLLLKESIQKICETLIFISAPTLPGKYATTEESSSAKCSRNPMFRLSSVIQRRKGQKRPSSICHQIFAQFTSTCWTG